MSKDISKKIRKIQKKLRHKLSNTRYQHTIGVAYTAGSLAMKYNVDINQAIIAGLLHDCAKYLSDEDILKKSIAYNLDISDAEYKLPFLLHAKLGAYFAKTIYGISDNNITDAIKWHTTGKPDMSTLEKIIYIADYIEPARYKMPNLDIIRKTAFEDIDECLKLILSDTINYLNNTNTFIDDTTQKTYEFYCR